MPIHTHTVTDGITAERRIYLSRAVSAAEQRADVQAIRAIVEEQNRLATFDGRITELERTCRRTVGVRKHVDQAQPAFGSRAWYAEEILAGIEVVRAALRRREPDVAASEAVLVGLLAAEAQAKFHWGVHLLREARRAKNHELSQRSAERRIEATADRDKAIRSAVTEYRATHPKPSTRQMAKAIAEPLDMKESTVRDRLRKLGIR